MKQDVNRLIPFELENENDVDDDVVRARRNAAVNADAFRQALIQCRCIFIVFWHKDGASQLGGECVKNNRIY